jgi:hypothetical protein
MKGQPDSKTAAPTHAPGTTPVPAPRKRFRIEKIEERVMPKKKDTGSVVYSSISGTIGGTSATCY